VSAEILLGCFAVLAGLVAALVEHRRYRDDAAVRERVTALECRLATAEERLRWTQDRVDALEAAPKRKK